MNLFKRKPKEETVSKAEHERLVDLWFNRWFDANRKLVDALREIEALRPDAAKYRRSVANLKQNRPRDKQQAEVGA